MRIVRTPEGHVLADPTGKKNGRGTYVHKTRECFENIVSAPGIDSGIDHKKYALNAAGCQAAILV